MDDEEFEKAVQAALDRNKGAILGRYREELGNLLKISDEQLRAIIPSSTRTETYNDLISVVKEASRANVQQADLKNKINTLGQDAIKIAKLAAIFV